MRNGITSFGHCAWLSVRKFRGTVGGANAQARARTRATSDRSRAVVIGDVAGVVIG
jgi:hypothetical protein